MAAKIGGILIDIAADVSKLIEGMNKAQSIVDKNVAMIKKSLGPLAGMFAGIVSIDAMKNIINTADAMGKQAQKLALSSEAWSKYTYVAKFAGVEISTLDSGMSKMIANINNFTRDGGGAGAKAFEELGISAEFAKKNFTSTEIAFDTIISKLQSMDDGYKKTALVQEIFGKGAANIALYANQGASEIERLGKQAETTGNIISQDFADGAAELNDGLETLGSIVTGVGTRIMTKFTPALVQASRAVSDFMGINSKLSNYELNKKIEETTKLLSWYENKAISSTKGAMKIKELSEQLASYKEQLIEVQEFESKAEASRKQFEDDLKIADEKKRKEEEEKKRREKELAESIAQAKKYALDKQQVEEEFSNRYMQSTMSRYDYEETLLKAQKEKYLNYGQEKVKVETWYQAELKKINNERAEEEEQKNREILEKQKEFSDEYNRTMLSRFDYERQLLEKQKEDWIAAKHDEVKIAEIYSQKKQEIAEEEADYFKRMEQDKREASNNWKFGMEDALKEYQKNANDSYMQSKRFFNSTLDGMSSSLADFVIDGKGKFNEFAESVLKDLAKIMIQKQMAGIVGNIMDTSGASSFFSNIFASANGNVFEGGHDVAFANGGVVGSPTYFPMTNGKTGLMGEAGPEAIIPLSRIGNDLGVKSIPSNVVLNITNNTSNEISANKVSELTRINSNGEAEKVLTIVIDGVSRNTLGMRDMIKGLK